MRVLLSEGSAVVRDMSIYYGGMGPTTVSAAKTCAAIVSKSVSQFLTFTIDLVETVFRVIFCWISDFSLFFLLI